MTIWLIKEATGRFYMEPQVIGWKMFIIAVLGFGFNLVQIRILHGVGGGHDHDHGPAKHDGVDNEAGKEGLIDKEGGEKKGHSHSHDHGHSHDNMNVQGAMLHVLGDLLSSVGVIIASCLIWYNPNLWWFDPICTYVFAIMICLTTLPLMKSCVLIMMEGTPDEIDTVKLQNAILGADPKSICEVHDLHVWKLGSGMLSMSCHVRTLTPLKTLALVTEVCRKDFALFHTTIQVEGLDDPIENPDRFACETDMHVNKSHKQTSAAHAH